MSQPVANLAGSSRDIALAGLAHLVGLVGPTGRFVYAHPAGRPDLVLEGYNMLRHCGTLWFMLRAVNDLDLTPDAATADALKAATTYAAQRMERPDWVAGDALALVTRGAVKTGGIGLALVMLAEYRRALARGLGAPDLPLGLEGTVTALQTYALAQIEGSDFLHKRLIADGTVLPFRSGYYTGEVLLGLFATGCRDPRMIAVTEALLARRYGLPEQSHWMAYATCEAAQRGLLGEERIIGYLTDLMSEIIRNPGYRDRRASTPIACRTEALTRFALLCDRWPGRFPPELRLSALRAADENLALQRHWYRDGQFWKGDGDPTVQIDYIQHNATAFLNRWLCA
jgi:hypothetical protein